MADVIIVETATPYATLALALAAVSTGQTIEIQTESPLAERVVLGSTQSGKAFTIRAMAGLTVTLAPVLSSTRLIDLSSLADGTAVTFENINFAPTGTQSYAVMYWANTVDAHLTFTNCTFTMQNNNLAYGLVHSAALAGSSRELTLTNCTFTSPVTATLTAGIGYFADFYKIIISGGTYTLSNNTVVSIDSLLTNVSNSLLSVTGATITGGGTVAQLRGVVSGGTPTVAYGTVRFNNNNCAPLLDTGGFILVSNHATVGAGTDLVEFKGNTGTTQGAAISVQKYAKKVVCDDNTITLATAANAPSRIFDFCTDPGNGGAISEYLECLRNKLRYAGNSATLHAVFLGQGITAGEVAYNNIYVNATLGIVNKGSKAVDVHHNRVMAPSGAMYLKSDTYNCSVHHNTFYATGTNSIALKLEKADTGGANLHPQTCGVHSNIICASGSGGYCVYDNTNAEDTRYDHGACRIDGNLYYAASSAKLSNLQGGDYAGSAAGLVALQAAWASVAADADGKLAWTDNDADSEFGDPLFLSMDPTDDNFLVVASTSPAADMDAGASTQAAQGGGLFKVNL